MLQSHSLYLLHALLLSQNPNYSMKNTLLLPLICLLLACNRPSNHTSTHESTPLLKALIIDGQNNHVVWPKSTVMMKQYLEETGLFTVEVARTAYTWQGDSLVKAYPIEGLPDTEAKPEPIPDPHFAPDFSKYDVVISNFGWKAADLPEATQKALEEFVGKGGGFVSVHAADNSWPKWAAFNEMIALGGWGNRPKDQGVYVYYNDAGEMVRDTTPGKVGAHGDQHEYLVVHRDTLHPITKGLPAQWRHAQDELYDHLRGPAKNLHVMGTAFADPAIRGSGRHEPILMTIGYQQGRIFHTPMGHEDYSFECVGFITLFNRGVEWAATGKVTQTEVPSDFPSTEQSSSRPFVRTTR